MAAAATLDLSDFDAVGIAAQIVVALRIHAIDHDADAVASVAAPAGWQQLMVTARSSGHVVLSIRYPDLSASRLHNISKALDARGWQLDEDGEGATLRFPPGSEPTTAAFEILGALTVGGAPADRRTITATDALGAAVDLSLLP